MAKSSRVKSDKPILPIKSWKDADARVREVGDCQLRIRDLEQKARDKIDVIKAELAAEVSGYQELITLTHRSLEAFAVNRQADFSDRRSRKLDFGVVGWRKSISISVKKTTIDRIKEVFSRQKAKQFIRTRETVDKEALARLTDEQLVGIGARRVHKDVFFVEPDFPEAANHSE